MFTFTGKLLFADFLLEAAPGKYGFLIEQDDAHRRGEFTVRDRKESDLNANEQGMLNYLVNRATTAPCRRSELTMVGNALALTLVERGLVTMDDDHRYIPV